MRLNLKGGFELDNGRYRILIVSISLGVFASVMSTTMLSIAYPNLVSHFHITYSVLQWRNIIFWSILGVGMPLFGKISDQINIKIQPGFRRLGD